MRIERRARRAGPQPSVLILALLLAAGTAAQAQTRERPVPFDVAGHVTVLTPPLAARLALGPPAWPVTGDYLEARLYALDDGAASFVLVVQRQQGVLDRTPLDSTRRRMLAEAVASGERAGLVASGPDNLPTVISEPVRGSFIFNQASLGLLLFGPAAAVAIDDPTGSTAGYLLVAGGAFFTSAALTTNQPISRAQNHLAWHSAVRGALAADLAVYALGGERVDDKTYAAAIFAGGLVGDVIGFQLAKPMTDAEAHGTSHGSTVAAALTAGVLGTVGLDGNVGGRRAASALIIGAGALGYPLGLHYVRSAPYRVTAGDVGTVVTAEFLGVGVASALIPQNASREVASGLLTAGFATGLLAGDQLLARPFDHTESEARLLAVGAGAGALIGVAIPVLAQSDNSNILLGAAAIGGILGAWASEQILMPRRAEAGERSLHQSGSKSDTRGPRVEVSFTPQAAVMAAMRQRGQHEILSLHF